MDTNEQPSGLNIIATLSILCAVLALTMPTLSRMLYASSTPGDDSAFTAMMMTPVLLAAGFVLALVARARRRDALSRLALWLNGGLLAAIVLFAGYAMFTYTGR